MMFKLGLVINPYAGIGGALALKGSDGAETRAKALAMGAEQKSFARTETALQELLPLQAQLKICTASGEMGEELARKMGFNVEVVYQCPNEQTEAEDTEATVQALMQHEVDVILFAGGDGTARNVCHIAQDKIPVLGVPAGCKIHSGVYAVTPQAAGRVIEKMIAGEIVTVKHSDVMDIDEVAFREGRVKARRYGEMQVPEALQYVQSVKVGGRESEELVLMDIAAHIIEEMVDDDVYVMGSGSTVAAVMDELGLDNTLLGVDVVQDREVLQADITAPELLALLQQQKEANPDGNIRLVITLIGGQGHVFGRGNQQLSPDVIRFIGKENIRLIATKSKLEALQGRPLIADTGDSKLDEELAGFIPVVTGYHDQVLYRLGQQ
ncbi:ATP-NAD kinase family protein [Paraneptunicella aestuarii]|uniref:ATP-NAD kinase family protein n=1 Tax=Paraneptunicella aestuarii TaxID=2831148 RepID=UPI001E61CA95|nr:ATP-NAD kinase family protein [Paraneptunicella aestuarii]